MASFHAIGATCEGVIRLLEETWQPALFNNTPLTFSVYRTSDFLDQPIVAGISLYLFRVHINNSQRIPPGHPKSDGTPRRPQLPLDLHMLLTPWADQASLQQDILGWMMRTLEDHSILSTALLNTPGATVFEDSESVEIVAGELTNEDILRIWDTIPGDYQISVPYVARVVRIDTELELATGEPVLERDLQFGQART